MARKTAHLQHRPAQPIDKLWLDKQFDEIDCALKDLKLSNAVVLERLGDLKKLILILTKGSSDLSPELEAAVIKVGLRAKAIDEKVLDK